MELPPFSTDALPAESSIIESFGGIVWEGDADTFTLLHVSEGAHHILGYPRARWLGESNFWRAHTYPADLEKCVSVWRDAARGQRSLEVDHRMIAADRRVVWLRTMLRSVPAVAGRSRLRGYSVDVTERAEQKERARQAETLAVVGRLTGGIAHDFNNWLTVITGYAETLLTAMGPADPNVGDVVEIRRAADRAALLTQQLLAFSRKQLLRPENIDAGTLVRAAVERIARLLGENVEVITDLTPEASTLFVDRTQFENVLLNLASNSRDAMPSGGRFELSTRIERVLEGSAEPDGVDPGTYVVLSAGDTGIGIPPETRAHVFEPFFTTKHPVGSSGIGLASVYGTVIQSGGRIFVHSEVGQGTRFDIYLPRTSTRIVESAAPTAAGGGTILLVEDYGRVRKLANKVLTRHGYRVLTAGSGEEALAIAARYDGTIDVLITDVIMPGMSGPELVQRIVASRTEIAVLYMSGYAGGVLDLHGVREGEMSFIAKPFTPADLTQKVRDVLARAATR